MQSKVECSKLRSASDEYVVKSKVKYRVPQSADLYKVMYMECRVCSVECWVHGTECSRVLSAECRVLSAEY